MLVEKLQGIFVYFNIFEYVEIVQQQKKKFAHPVYYKTVTAAGKTAYNVQGIIGKSIKAQVVSKYHIQNISIIK